MGKMKKITEQELREKLVERARKVFGDNHLDKMIMSPNNDIEIMKGMIEDKEKGWT